MFLLGFSLGGNVVLKLAGELGTGAAEMVAGVAAVSTPIDLAACVQMLQRPSNIIYSRRFLKRLKERIRAKSSSRPDCSGWPIWIASEAIYEFDDLFTARSFGFGTADNYYATQSSNQFLEHIRVPALLVQAKDDPLIPFEIYEHPAFEQNPYLRLLAVDHGGHLGFIAKTQASLLAGWGSRRLVLEARNKVQSALRPL